jgi:hypothetical protein
MDAGMAADEFCRRIVTAPSAEWVAWARTEGTKRRIVAARVLATRPLTAEAALVVIHVKARAISWQSLLTWMGGEILFDVRTATLYKLAVLDGGAWRIPDESPDDESDRDRIDALTRTL